MTKHEWSEESFEGTASSGFRHCLACGVGKTVQNQNEECWGVLPARLPSFESRVSACKTPEGRTRISMLLHEQIRSRLPREPLMPIQQVPDEVLLPARMTKLIEDAFAENLSGEQIQDLFWRSYLAFCKVPYKELTPEESAAAWAHEEEILVRAPYVVQMGNKPRLSSGAGGLSPNDVLRLAEEAMRKGTQGFVGSASRVSDDQVVAALHAVGVICAVKDEVWRQWCLQNQREYAPFIPQPITGMPSVPPYEGYAMLAFPFYWWKLEDLEIC